MIFFLTQGEIRRSLGQFLALEPSGIFGKSRRRLPIDLEKFTPDTLVFYVPDRVHEIGAKEIRRAARNLDRKFDVRFWQDRIEIGLCGNEHIGDLCFDHDDAVETILDGGETTVEINAHVSGACVDHWVALVGPHVLALENLPLDRRLQDAQVNRLALAELIEVENLETIVEPAQAGQLGV